MARSITQICNEAISDLPAHPITDINDSRKEARECSRHLSGVVSDLVSYHDWQFVRRRVALAMLTNDREGEWGYAYDLGGEIVSPIKLVRNYDSTGSDAGVVVTPVLYWPNAGMAADAIDYEVANGVLYTNLEEAVLEYSTDALEPNKWTPLFAQAVIRTLASRIYRPILGEKADSQEWALKVRAAKQATDEAVADDLNRNPRVRKEFISEAAMARGAQGYGGLVWRR